MKAIILSIFGLTVASLPPVVQAADVKLDWVVYCEGDISTAKIIGYNSRRPKTGSYCVRYEKTNFSPLIFHPEDMSILAEGLPDEEELDLETREARFPWVTSKKIFLLVRFAEPLGKKEGLIELSQEYQFFKSYEGCEVPDDSQAQTSKFKNRVLLKPEYESQRIFLVSVTDPVKDWDGKKSFSARAVIYVSGKKIGSAKVSASGWAWCM